MSMNSITVTPVAKNNKMDAANLLYRCTFTATREGGWESSGSLGNIYHIGSYTGVGYLFVSPLNVKEKYLYGTTLEELLKIIGHRNGVEPKLEKR